MTGMGELIESPEAPGTPVETLTGALLAYWVAQAEDLTGDIFDGVCHLGAVRYMPQEDWGFGGPLIDREDLCLDYDHNRTFPDGGKVYRAWYKEQNEISAYSDHLQEGRTTLEAAMRCIVHRKYGETVPVR